MPWSKDNLPDNVKGMDLSDHQIDIFIKAANAALKEYSDEGKAIATGIAAAKGEVKHNDKIPGGIGDNETLQKIADKHDVPLEKIKEQFKKGVKVEMEHTDEITKAAEIARDHLTEHYDYYTKLALAEQKMNSLDKKGEIVYIRHCESGLAEYPDEVILINDDCLKDMIPTMAGIPIYIDHVNEVDMDKADGYVTECIYNQLDGCYWAKSLITDQDAYTKVLNGYGASNAYIPKQMGNGGMYNGAKYDREVLKGEYTHLALVTNPRYNKSMILTPQEYKDYNEKEAEKLKELQNSLSTQQDEENEQMAKDVKGLIEHLTAFFNSADEDEKDKEKQNECDKDKKIEELQAKLNECETKMKEMEEKKNEEEDEDEKEEKEEEKKNSQEKQVFNSLADLSKTSQPEVVSYWSERKGEEMGYKSFTR